MRILLLSCNTGQGHNSAAKAIQDAFEQQGHTCNRIDALTFISQRVSDIISNGHVFMYRRLPKMFGTAYRFEERYSAKHKNAPMIYKLMARGADALGEYLDAEPCDAVICTHLFGAMMLTECLKKKSIAPKTGFVSTDYTCYPGLADITMDYYFIPAAELAADFAATGIPPEKLIPTGVPINPVFYHCEEKEKARKKLSLPANKRIAVLSSGSMGCGPIDDLAKALHDTMPEDAHLVVICGTNRNLYKKLSKYADEKMTVVGFTKQMSLYLDAADLLITKPGGLSSTEAAVKHLPMVFLYAVPGCETRNLEFFLSRGFAVSATGVDAISSLVKETISQPDKLEAMKNKLETEFYNNAARDIVNTVTR